MEHLIECINRIVAVGDDAVHSLVDTGPTSSEASPSRSNALPAQPNQPRTVPAFGKASVHDSKTRLPPFLGFFRFLRSHFLQCLNTTLVSFAVIVTLLGMIFLGTFSRKLLRSASGSSMPSDWHGALRTVRLVEGNTVSCFICLPS